MTDGTVINHEVGSVTARGDAPVLEVRGVSKSYGAVTALDRVDFHLGRGEIVGLVGDNGAGKSTLIKVLSGAVQPDGGEIFVDGEPMRLTDPRAAQALGIETVYQDLALFDDLSVAANMFAGREDCRPAGFLRHAGMDRFTSEVIRRLRVDVPSPKAAVRNLSGGQRQAVAVARSVAFGSKVVMLDEPTSALSASAAEQVLDLVRDLRQHGISVILIAHNVEHVRAVCDRICVLRRGRMSGVLNRDEATTHAIVTLMVGG